ncbi:MAG: helix-turn-helix transcriptional regulator [Lachnospiraceae bacterium]|nr:helix-turn-helix transcriptional regulator [Lachnospiraceae bacterium]
MDKKTRNTLKTNHLMKIASYLLVFSFLSNILYIPCYFYIRQINRATVVEHYQYKLNNGMQMLDASIDSIQAFGYLISKTPAYNELYYTHAEIDSAVLNDLREVMSTSLTSPYGFISNFGLTQDDRILFTKEQIYFNREYLTYDFYFSCDEENYFDMFTNTYCFLPAAHFNTTAAGAYDAVTFGYRCSARKDMYLFIHYPLQKLAELFVDHAVLDTSQIALYHGDTLLACIGSSPEDSFELLTVSSSTGRNIRLELKLSDSYIEQDLAGFRHLVQIFLIIILFAVCLWVALFSWRIASPLNLISKTLYETGHFYEDSFKRNSTDIIVDGIKKMGVKLSDYSQIIDGQKERNRIHLLEKALYRGLYDESSRQSFAEAFPDFPANWQLAMIQYTSDDNPKAQDSIQLLLTQYFQQKLPNMVLLPYSQDALLAFFPADDESSPVTELEGARKYIQEQYPVSISFAVSQIYHHYSLLSDALQQLEYETIALQQFSSSPAHRRDLPISIQQIQAIYLALQNGDEQSAISALRNGSASFLTNNRQDLATAKYSHQMIVYALIRIKLENNILDVSIPHFKAENVQYLFEVELPQCFTQITIRLKQQHVNQMQNLDQNIFAFIDENIGNQQLCVSMVTDYFHISAPTLQKRMNSCVSKTFSAYVEDLRMKKAHQMLQDTYLTVQEIAESVGYTNANSFYKAYKRYFGEAPRSTRKNNDL